MGRPISWQYNLDELSYYDEKTRMKFIIRRGNNGGIYFQVGSSVFEVKDSDINYVFFSEPKFFKEGLIACFDHSGNVLKYNLNGRSVAIVVGIKRKYKDIFYAMFSVLKNNGYNVKV